MCCLSKVSLNAFLMVIALLFVGISAQAQATDTKSDSASSTCCLKKATSTACQPTPNCQPKDCCPPNCCKAGKISLVATDQLNTTLVSDKRVAGIQPLSTPLNASPVKPQPSACCKKAKVVAVSEEKE